ncbi:MAG: hypothetical protein IPJ82_21145 [Lewinellaceae bacterium]|nr:hypothetical protein [Lewinellaceae bacterium]
MKRTILSEEHLFSLSGTFKFETIGFLGRLLCPVNRRTVFPGNCSISAADTWFDGWTNGDFFTCRSGSGEKPAPNT